MFQSEADALAEEGPVVVGLSGREISVIPLKLWPSSLVELFLAEDWDSWAYWALSQDSYSAWVSSDPNLEEISSMLKEWEEVTGQPVARLKFVYMALKNYETELEADLRHWHGVRLSDLWRPAGKLTWRELASLIRGLPQESLYFTALRNNTDPEDLPAPSQEHGPWSRIELLLAKISDEINWLIWQNSALNRKEGSSAPPKPKPISRPGVDDGPSRITNEAFEFLEARRRAHEEQQNGGE